MKLCTSEQLGLAVLSIVAFICLPQADASPIGWEFAVTLRTKILFLDNQWNTITSAAHEYDKLSGLAFDEAEEVIYFNDQVHQTGSIFSLRRDAMAATHIVEQAVQRTGNDSVAGLAYDPLNRNLFWVDTHQSKIFFASIDTLYTEPPKVLVDLSAEGKGPESVAVDICRRQLYWTSYIGRVERIGLNGTGRQTIVEKNIDMPRGIVVDQLTDRIFWMDKSGIFFTVESSNLDGSDRQLVLKDQFQDPIQLAVTEDTIYWTDRAKKAVWSYPKPTFTKPASNSTESNAEMHPMPTIKQVATFTEDVHGIVARTGFYQHLQKDAHCASVVRKVKQRLDNKTNSNTAILNLTDKRVEQLEREHCLNGGNFRGRGNFCVCQVGYKGARCEISECHNFCVHGTCEISDRGFPKCYCQPEYYGERCGYNKCADHCLNGGHCTVNHDSGELNCECTEHFTGTRCEHNTTESCSIYCLQLKQQADTVVPDSCLDICDELLSNNSTSIAEYRQARLCSTQSVLSGSVIIVLVAGIVASLCLVALIVHGLRLIYKPKRPHIKKTFVVRKQARHNSSSDTPLTNRPLATEQCEITIENCCNMNICETPCFDPKLVEQTFSARDKKAPRIKEDKKILINNMEDDLLS